MYKPNKILVIGGNAAGPAAAAKAKRVNPDAEVILFETGEYISTGNCELPYVLSGEIENYEDIIFFTAESFYKEKGVRVYTKHFVESIDKRNKSISVRNLNDNSVVNFSYDKLILCTGSKANKLKLDIHKPENVFYLKSVSDYLAIKNYIDKNPVNSVGIIGSGYIGLESAEAFKKLGMDVLLIDKENYPLPTAEIEIQHLINEQLKGNEIDFYGNQKEIKFICKDNKVTSIKIDGRFVEIDLLLVAIGFKPNTELAQLTNLNLGNHGGLKVDKKLKTSDTNIYAAGDCCEITNKITGRANYLPLATLAHKQGHIAGDNAAGGNSFYNPIIKNIAVKIFDNVYSAVGLNTAETKQNGFNFNTVSAVTPNLVKVMPESKKVFGKIIYDKYSKFILGAEFFGNSEVIGYADLISSMISNKIKVNNLAEIDFNYTPPYSPFVNLLSILGRKAI